MPKVRWASDDALTASDIDTAEEFPEYIGEMPPPGVYRFAVTRVKKTDFNSGNQGLTILMTLDGSWKPAHAKWDGCPLWDRIVMTKAAAGFVKAFATAIGASSKDMIAGIVVDEDDVVTRIGPVALPLKSYLYVNVKRDEYEGVAKIARSGAGYIPVERAEPEAKPDELVAGKGKPGKAGNKKSGKKSAPVENDESPF